LGAEIKQAKGIDVELIRGDRGAFEVRVDGELVFSKLNERRFPETEEILASL
jgi:selT/selW/selH-like putative selenoprotein